MKKKKLVPYAEHGYDVPVYHVTGSDEPDLIGYVHEAGLANGDEVEVLVGKDGLRYPVNGKNVSYVGKAVRKYGGDLIVSIID